MDSNIYARFKVVTQDGITTEIKIAREVKQSCQRNPILFDICIDPLIEIFSLA
jgi:hypothetical protein